MTDQTDQAVATLQREVRVLSELVHEGMHRDSLVARVTRMERQIVSNYEIHTAMSDELKSLEKTRISNLEKELADLKIGVATSNQQRGLVRLALLTGGFSLIVSLVVNLSHYLQTRIP